MRTTGLVAGAVLLVGCSEVRASGDASVAVANVEVVGDWFNCSNHVSIDADGTIMRVDDMHGCTITGTWTIDGANLDIEWDVTASSCEIPDDGISVHQQVVRVEHGLIAVGADGRPEMYADPTVPRQDWSLMGGVPGEEIETSVVRIIGVPRVGVGTACYWSADGECGGLISCAGNISQWDMGDDGNFVGTAVCAGHCPCTATLLGMRQGDGSIEIDYSGANCERSFEGTFVATRPDRF